MSALDRDAVVAAEIDLLRAAVSDLESRLWEAHDQLCGCNHPTDEGRCSAPVETWGAFELLGERSERAA